MEHLEAQLKKLRDIRMTEAEKADMTRQLSAFMERNPVRTPSPIQKVSFRTPSPYAARFSFANFARSAAFLIVGMIIGGGALSSASASALPGDLLYPTKVNFNEEVVAALKVTPDAKIAYEETRVETRIAEAETLVATGSMDETKGATFETTVDVHLAKLDGHVRMLPEARRAEIANTIEARVAMKVRNEKAFVRAHILAKTDAATRPIETTSDETTPAGEPSDTGSVSTTPADTGTTTPTSGSGTSTGTEQTSQIDYAQIANRTILAAEAKLAIVTKVTLSDDTAQARLRDRITVIKHTIADAKRARDAGEYMDAIALARRSITLSESTKLAIDRYLKAQLTSDTEVSFQL